MKKLTNSSLWYPIIIALGFLGGFGIANLLGHSGRSDAEKKLANIFNLISTEYVDQVSIDSIIEKSLPAMLTNLDPHSVYIPAAELQKVNDELAGSFSGVGVQFTIENDTVFILEAISGGPSQRVGIRAGDRILAVDGKNFAGVGITNDSVFNYLRGQKGTDVTLTVKRKGVSKPIDYVVTRGDIPISSIDAEYVIADSIGYIRVNKFARTTYDEFFQSLFYLRDEGAKDYIIDLRSNPGGLLESAILMANEFLHRGSPIVSTIGRRSSQDSQVVSDGLGSFQDSRVVVLLDEISASSSEVFAGALQDNDRALIMGRRSFGKGLVQNQIDLPDGSALRLTVARYHTPSGRCIQKDYSDAEAYEYDIIDRYNHGEFLEEDSIKFDDTLRYTTLNGRTVYGGGGIMPDTFVPNDTTGYTKYAHTVINNGLLHRYAFKYVDENRTTLEQALDLNELMAVLPSDGALLNSFVRYAQSQGVDAQWYYINQCASLLTTQLKALIARDVLGTGAWYQVANNTDNTVQRAIEEIRKGNADFPLSEKSQGVSNE